MRFLLSVVFLLCCIACWSQVETTEAEYVYLTKGYGPQVIEQGGDLKSGYELKDLSGILERGNYQFEFRGFIRSSTKEMSSVLSIIRSGVSGRTYYLCIPINNRDLALRYFKELDLLDGSLCREYAKVCAIYFAIALEHIHESEK